MVFGSVEELCDALLKSKILHCSKCKGLLQPPVAIVDEQGTVCQTCFQKFYSDTNGVTANTDLDSFLKQLDFACDFEGCGDRINITDHPMHVEYCSYRDLQCEVNFCSWKGARKVYLEHFIEQHEVNVITGDWFDVVDLEEDESKTSIVQTSCGGFVVCAMLTADNYYFMTSEIGHRPQLSKFKVLIKYSQNSQSIYIINCEVFQSNKILGGITLEKAAVVERAALNAIFSCKELTIRWELDVDNALVLLYKAVPVGKCSICAEYWEFTTSNLCSLCFLKVRSCKCKKTLPTQENHLSICPNYSWNCPICEETVDYLDFGSHLEAEHRSAYINSNEIYVTDHVLHRDTKVYYLRTFGRIFQIEHQCKNIGTREQLSNWYVNVIGPEHNRFIFEVEIYSDQCPGKSFLMYNECEYNNTDTDSIDSNSVNTITYTMLQDLVSDVNKYVFSVRIKPYKQ